MQVVGARWRPYGKPLNKNRSSDTGISCVCFGLASNKFPLDRTRSVNRPLIGMFELSEHPFHELARRSPSPLSATQQDESELQEQDSLLATADTSNGKPGPAGGIDWWMTGLCFVFPAVGGALFGYDIGATSGALLSITSPQASGTDWYDLNAFQSGVVVSASLAGALMGSIGALAFGDKLGRRKELLLAAGLYGTSAVLLTTAPSLGLLYLGRTMYGVGIGFAMHAAPAYIAETAPSSVRGLLISLKEGFIVAGILLGYLTSFLWVDVEGGWRLMYGAAALPAALLAAGMIWLPESPRWLLLSGAPKQVAADALIRVKGAAAGGEQQIQRELASVTANLRRNQEEGVQGYAQLFQSPNLRPLLVGMSLMLYQQITGQPSVLYYAAKIFQDVGFGAASEATAVAVVLGLFKLVMTGVAVLSVDQLGRRVLLLSGVSGMVLALLLLTFSSSAMPGASGGDNFLAWVSVAALLLYVGCYQVSFGPISWLIVGEIFPLSVRGPALALATITNFASNFGVSLVLPSVQEAIGLGNTYLVFAVIGMGAVGSIYATVPETKGKTLEEIEAMWRGNDQ